MSDVDFETRSRPDDRFRIDAGRDELNMLQRALDSSPYPEVQVMRGRIVLALMGEES